MLHDFLVWLDANPWRALVVPFGALHVWLYATFLRSLGRWWSEERGWKRHMRRAIAEVTYGVPSSRVTRGPLARHQGEASNGHPR